MTFANKRPKRLIATSGGVALFIDEADRSYDFGKARPSKRHGLNRSCIEGLVRSNQEKPRLQKLCRFLVGNGFRNVETPLSAKRNRHFISEVKPVEPPVDLAALSSCSRIAAYSNRYDTKGRQFIETLLKFVQITLTYGAMEPAVEYNEGKR